MRPTLTAGRLLLAILTTAILGLTTTLVILRDGDGPPGTADAERVTRAWVAEHTQAELHNDRARLEDITTGPAQEVMLHALGDRHPDDGGPAPRLRDVQVTVPHHDGPTDRFMAFVTTDDLESGTEQQVLSFVRGAGSARWRVELRAWLPDGTPWPQLDPDRHGRGSRIAADTGDLALAPETLPELYGRYVAQADRKDHPERPAELAAGPFTTGRVKNLDAWFNSETLALNRIDYLRSDDGTVAWQTDDGGALVLFTVRTQTLYGGGNWQLLQNPSRSNWGRRIAAGQYERIMFNDLTTVVALIPASSGDETRIIAVTDGEFSLSTTPKEPDPIDRS